jgi:hypothetical protein
LSEALRLRDTGINVTHNGVTGPISEVFINGGTIWVRILGEEGNSEPIQISRLLSGLDSFTTMQQQLTEALRLRSEGVEVSFGGYVGTIYQVFVDEENVFIRIDNGEVVSEPILFTDFMEAMRE